MTADELKDFPLLHEFGEEDRQQLLELLDEEHVAAGNAVFQEGDEADTMWLVAEGRVRIGAARSGQLGLVCDGAALGCVSLVVVGRREANAVAESDCRLLALSRSGFRRLAEDAPRTACRLAEAIIRDQSTTLRENLSRFDDLAAPAAG